jgi:hypothetical protein
MIDNRLREARRRSLFGRGRSRDIDVTPIE